MSSSLTFIITSECMKCGICADICPADAIIDGDDQHVITEACISCGKCRDACPIYAIQGKNNKSQTAL